MAKAKCLCVMVNLETEECMSVGAFTDDGTGLDPKSKCEALWRSVEGDWPGYVAKYVMNDEAAELASAVTLWQCGMKDDNVMTERIEAHNREMDRRREDAKT